MNRQDAISQLAQHDMRSGFSLIQLSIILAVGGLVVAGSLPGGEAELGKTRLTMERMQKIEAATQQFMARNQRRPYPADLTAGFGSASYGVEITPPTDFSAAVTTHYVSASESAAFNQADGDNSLTGGTTTGTGGALRVVNAATVDVQRVAMSSNTRGLT